MLKRVSRSPNERRSLYYSPDRGVSDPLIGMSESNFYSTFQEKLRAGIGYSSAAAGWSDDVIAECWSLPPTEAWRVQLRRHRFVVNVGPTPTYVKWDDDGDVGEALHASAAISLMPLGQTSLTAWTSNLNVVVLEFSVELMNRLLDGRDGNNPSEQLISRRNTGDRIANTLAYRVMAEMAAPTERLYGEMLCIAFAVHALQAYGRAQVEVARGRLSSIQARRVLDYIHADLGDKISVAAVAREVGLSEAHFARLFRATFGEPPHRLVLRWRLERAARFVRVEGLSLADAALAAGFCDQAHLTNATKRHFGVTPGRWFQESHGGLLNR